MKHRTRIYFSAEQRADIWDRWQHGESMSSIGRLFERESSSIYPILASSGGIRPPTRKRSRFALSLSEREEISRGVARKQSIRGIALQIKRSPSTISRELTRNGGYDSYRASAADQAAWDRAHRPKRCKLARRRSLAKVVAAKLQQQWSPQQIAGWLKRQHPDREHERVSHETIYRSLYIQARGVLKKELQACLRTQRAIRRSKHASLKRQGLGKITNAVSIKDRPASVEDRAVPGHWEGDLIGGTHNSYIATLVERHSRYVMLAKIEKKDAETVAAALIKHAQRLPTELYQSLTWDRGTEMAKHQHFTLATDIAVYFCDPKSPWQRGSNENTNRLLRQYLPKGTDLSRHTQAQLNTVARQLNERPRKTLDYETPAEKFHACVAATG
ncbi:IS30 family transposase [Candidatus Nitronereus thalassa]|uniref:IS30 family transposase n=1 Tax=Candidatus Nitronereus thalassa TaxID=3020898 RepID=A0ABU3K322_9BACT|nr:IS30 family transposase [Candidatus Nitronereus thalassa]MDT7040789.1 IS30 family transposase [Candidatus Nitronereus thalassa]